MTRLARTSLLAAASALAWAMPAHAQSAADFAQMKAQMEAMQAQMQAMQQQISTLQGQLADAQGQAQAATAKAESASAAVAALPAPTASAKPATQITWDGAPKLQAAVDPKRPEAGTWSFKPRGRLQVDVAGVNAPNAIGSKSLGLASEFRRAYIGFDGTIPGNFGYRVEADLAGSSVELTDLYLTYNGIKHVTLTVGQHKPFWGFEEMTSDLFTSFMERAAFNSGFGYERRLGASAQYQNKALLLQGGVFTDNAADLNADTNNSYSVDVRAAFQPKVMGGQLHLGGSFHYRDFNDASTTARYRARPFTHTTDLRLIDTKAFGATGERSVGVEAAWTGGRWHAQAESAWLTALRPGALADPTFNGGYAEVGYFLTDDTLPYKAGDGTWNRIRPKHPVGSGGMGALQVNARYDWLDLTDGVIVGGKQQVAGVSMLWVPTDYVRFILNYGHLWLDNAAVPAGADKNYNADTIGMRAQFDF